MKKKMDRWESAEGILDELHRIREENHRERQRIGAAAWLKKVNSAGKRLGYNEPGKRTHAQN